MRISATVNENHQCRGTDVAILVFSNHAGSSQTRACSTSCPRHQASSPPSCNPCTSPSATGAITWSHRRPHHAVAIVECRQNHSNSLISRFLSVPCFCFFLCCLPLFQEVRYEGSGMGCSLDPIRKIPTFLPLLSWRPS